MSRHIRTSIDETIPPSEWQVDFDNTICADLALSTNIQADSLNLSEYISGLPSACSMPLTPKSDDFYRRSSSAVSTDDFFQYREPKEACSTSGSMSSKGGTSLSASRVRKQQKQHSKKTWKMSAWAHENKKTRDKMYRQQREQKRKSELSSLKEMILNLKKDKSDLEYTNSQLIAERDQISSNTTKSELSSQETLGTLEIVNNSLSARCAGLEDENGRLKNTIQWYGSDCSKMIDTLASISKDFEVSVEEQDERNQSRIEYLESLVRELQK
ncbi:hypothetical protein I203_100713 [Kwoniella mangroviensis CBS 8507]|uniref:uncharacterized protein n=1 Tax=Kwoniella mangroviensis CBS 8507 TaxID=1296122 RepID=UPI00080CBF37|nr:uncharacterized protein I203_06753 [Kwoniella mangroviensis CBS 8507]OCF64169.1 hypothetical protein I203_06753 [Kwoniella mangroviensis CBS 8507]